LPARLSSRSTVRARADEGPKSVGGRRSTLFDDRTALRRPAASRPTVVPARTRQRRLAGGPSMRAPSLPVAAPGVDGGTVATSAGVRRLGSGLVSRSEQIRLPAWFSNMAGTLALLAAFNGAVALSPLLPARAYAIAFALLVPGAVMLSLTPLHPREATVRIAWSLGGSMLVIMLIGLAFSELLPHLGDRRPLTTWSLTLALDAATFIGGAVRAPKADPLRYLVERPPRNGELLLFGLLLLVPLGALAGAERLNNGASGQFAFVVLALVGVGLAALVVKGNGMPGWVLSASLYAAASATLLGTTMRSNYPFGFDIQIEYRMFASTLAAGAWHVPANGNAYAAMLSITVLPTALAAVSHVSGVTLFKLIYPLVFSIFPSLIFCLTSRWFPARAALFGPAVVIAQGFYAASIGALARQDIGLVYFALLVVTAFDDSLPRAVRQCGSIAAAVGMAISHYSTAYFACVILSLSYVMVLGGRLATGGRRELTLNLRRVTDVLTRLVQRLGGRTDTGTPGATRDAPGRSTLRLRKPIFTLPVLICTLGVVYAWNVVITRSAQNVANVVSSISEEGLQVLPASHGTSVISRILNADVEPAVGPAEFLRTATHYYSVHDPWIHPYSPAVTARFAVRTVAVPSIPSRVPATLQSMLTGLNAGANEVLLLLVGIGALYLVWDHAGEHLSSRLESGMLAVSCVCLLVVLRTSATVALLYNAPRGQVQGSVLLSLGLAALGARVTNLVGRRRVARVVACVALAGGTLFLLSENSGASEYLLGGGAPDNLVDFGEGFQRYYFTDADMATARWLAGTIAENDVVYADPYGALQLASVSAFGRLVETVAPPVLEPRAWVYGSSTNIVSRTTRANVAGEATTFSYPLAFLRHVKNLVFTTATTAVYK
jgi:uncharacterized membrane protein